MRPVGVSRCSAFAGSSVKLSSGTGGNCRLKALPVLKYSARDSALDRGADARWAGRSAMDCGSGSLSIFSSSSVPTDGNARTPRYQTRSSCGYRSAGFVGRVPETAVFETTVGAAQRRARRGRLAVDPGGEQGLQGARRSTPDQLSRPALLGFDRLGERQHRGKTAVRGPESRNAFFEIEAGEDNGPARRSRRAAGAGPLPG